MESARIARSDPTPLTELKAADLSAVVFPGGFGAAKNLSDFGFKVLITHNSYFVIYGTFKFAAWPHFSVY